MKRKRAIRSAVGSGARRAMLAAAVLVLVVGGVVTAARAMGPTGGYTLVETPAAAAHQAAGYCNSSGTTTVCKEWCLLTLEGHAIPQGNFICVDE